MEALIPIDNNGSNDIVSARDLYSFLEIKTDFSEWCKRMFDYGFEQDKDFTPILGKSTGGRPSTDFALTLDTAKEISMLQRNEKGKQARQYFIEVEKQRNKPLSQIEILQQSVNLLAAQDKRLTAVETKMQEIEAKTTTRPEYFTVAGYASLIRKKVGIKEAAEIGRKAAKICRDKGHGIDEVHDARYGKVGAYPKEVLQELFNAATP